MDLQLFRECFDEFKAMMLFVFVGCGTAMAFGTDTTAGVLAISLSFGLAITVLVYMTAHTSGGHVNCAVTFAMFLVGAIDGVRAICYIISQILGAIAGAAFLALVWKKEDDLTKGLGTNAIASDRNNYQVWIGEALMTYLLVTVIFQTAVNKNSVSRVHSESRPSLAPIPIGLAVFLAHQVLISLDGCSINPTRTLGPAIIGCIRYNSDVFDHIYIFMLAPMIGAAIAAFQEIFFQRLSEMQSKVEMQTNEELQMTNTADAYPQKTVDTQPQQAEVV